MKKYILDTNIASLLGSKETKDNRKIYEKFYQLNDEDVVMVSIVTLYEATYGLKHSEDEEQQEEIRQNIAYIRKYFEIIPLDLREMELFADLKVLYKKKTGINKKAMKKNDLDILIASTAMAKSATLISDDGIFKKLSEIEPKFKWENWLT
jgi:predicted nucleic acid-binding protein